jgi:hypothetical protein
MRAGIPEQPSISDFFDLNVEVPPWAMMSLRTMDPRIIPTSAFAGQALWQHLALEALNEGTGVLPGSVLSVGLEHLYPFSLVLIILIPARIGDK